ncbi:DUF6864 domain-containing function [Pseudomonas sp. S3E17]|jgi:hypothetical protein|uniref:DUF6864 domain-containing function n=1 Tax=Pseudomonas sp. S3E17 TaxID=2817893 RepID=UPI00209FB5B4|nr:hypothetical protein [Pseudomonas sp. S3E17]MCP1464412.1 hypothetical protein [Pseudomonas sp. S3E17]
MFEVKAYVSGYEVVATGEVHALNSPIDFHITGLKLRFSFENIKDGTTARFASENVDGVLNIKLINFNNTLGEGVLSPLPIASIDGRDIAVTFYVHSMENDLGTARRFTYCFLLGPEKNV